MASAPSSFRTVTRRWADSLLRLLVRLLPSERRRVFVLTLLVGAVCGVAAVAFHEAILLAENLFIGPALALPMPWLVAGVLLTPTLGGLLSGILLYYVVPDARGSGIPQVKVAYSAKGGVIPFRVAVGKFALGALQIGTGASLGREGPTVQICAAVASSLGQAAALSRRNLRMLLPVGAASGVAAAFNAPVAAVTFAIEEIVGDLDQTLLSGVIIAAALAVAVERGLLGATPVLAVPQGYTLNHADSLILYALLGVAAAFVSLAFTESLLRLWFGRMHLLPGWAKPAVGGFATGALALVALLFFRTGGVTGGGYDALSEALAGKLALHVLAGLCVMKLLATVFSYSSGGAGGIFAPALFIGAMLGVLFGALDIAVFGHDQVEIGTFAVVGMGAAFAGIVRAPITSILIIFEMTGGYGLILPLMIANMISYVVARRLRPVPIYKALLAQDGIHLPHGRPTVAHAIERIRINDAMIKSVSTVDADRTVAEALDQVASENHTCYPVLDQERHFVGMITLARLRRVLAEEKGDRLVRDLVTEHAPLSPEQPLVRALVLMQQHESRHLAVTEPADPTLLAGIISMSDVLRAQANAAIDTGTSFAEAATMSEVQEEVFGVPSALARNRPSAQGHMRYQLAEIGPDSPGAGRLVRDLALPEGVVLISIDRAQQTLVPRGPTVIEPGNKVVFADSAAMPKALALLVG